MSGFATYANGPLPVGDKKPPRGQQEQLQPQLRMVGLAVSPTTFNGVPAGGATTKVIRQEQEGETR
jgi:hypothetical protein